MLKIKILIIDDEEDYCMILKHFFSKKGCEVFLAYTLKQGLQSLHEHSIDILFLDNNLPDGYGVDFIQHIKDSHPSTRIVMITADDTLANKNKALKAGADFFIGKPFTRDTINKTIDTVMAESIQ